MEKERNYAQFYTLIKQLPYADKEQLVYQYTSGKTTLLREMKDSEYRKMVAALQQLVDGDNDKATFIRKLKRQRSICLKLMQQLGIDTTDWARIDNFCEHPKIMGKPFRRITLEELKKLQVKLRSIERKGGLNQKANIKNQTPEGVVILPLAGGNKTIN